MRMENRGMTNEQEIRAKAFELALKYLTNSVPLKDIVDLADLLIDYIMDDLDD